MSKNTKTNNPVKTTPPPVASKKNKVKIPQEPVEVLQDNGTVAKQKVKGESSLNPASKKIQKQAVEVVRNDKEKHEQKQATKQEKKQENSGKKPKAAKKEAQAAPAPQEEIDIVDIKSFPRIAKERAEKYAQLRRSIIPQINLDKHQIKDAVTSLIKYHNSSKKQNQLLDNNEDFIYLEIVLSEVPAQYSIRPVQVKLPVPIYGAQYQSRFAIISKDPQREFKDKIQDLDIPCVAKVIGYTKLVKNHPQYNDKRKLFYDFDLFFCDYKLYNLLRKATGKIFYERKKIPFPIDCEEVPEHQKEDYKSYQDYLNGLADSTYFIMGNGPVYTVKVARVSMSVKDTVKNVIHGVYNTLPHILKDKINCAKVRQVSIKTADSISLPVFNQLTDEELSAYLAKEVSRKGSEAIEEEDDE